MISVIIIVYDAENFLHVCLNSVLKQTYQDFEIICIDNVSTDSSLEILEYFSQKDSRIKISKNNKKENFEFCKNKGLDIAKGEKVIFLNADEWLRFNALEILSQEPESLIEDKLYNKISDYRKESSNLKQVRETRDYKKEIEKLKEEKISLQKKLGQYKKPEIIKKIINKDYSNLKIAIKSPHPKGTTHWGDLFFSNALKKSFEKIGFNVVAQEREQWYDDEEIDIAFVLRGLVDYNVDYSNINLMWNISHPDMVSKEEYEKYDHVFISSKKYANKINNQVNVPVSPLLQCTNPEVFYPETDKNISDEILFVGVTRGVYREIVKDIMKTNHEVSIYGMGWEKYIDEKYIKGQFIPNEELHKYYSSCKILLNDHWEDMRDEDFPSNRLFDALACGTFVISDKIPSAETLFDGSIVTYDDADDLNEKIDYYLTHEEERVKLAEKGKKIVLENHTFDKRVEEILSALTQIENFNLKNKYEDLNNIHSNKKILFVLHSGSGGTPKTVNDIVNNINDKFDCYLLTSDTHFMILSHYDGHEFKEIEKTELHTEWASENVYSEEYYDIYLKYLMKYSFDIVHIHHLIFHTFDLPKLCKELNIPVVLSVHDLYFICQAYTLLDGDLRFCGGDCENSNSEKECFLPMNKVTKIKSVKTFVKEWRKLVYEMFSCIDFFIMPSKFLKNIILDNYNLPEDKILIIEHGIDFDQSNQNLFEVPNSNNPVKILFLGNLYPQKGVSIIKELYELDREKKLEFHFLGFAPEELSEIGINHGVYENDKLVEYIKEIRPSFIGIFTLCGESYCYTLSEAWSFGIPVLVSELGALKERVSENGGGWFIDVNDMNSTYSKIISIINNVEEYCSKQKDIKNISLISTKSMANNYLKIYNNLLNNDLM